MVSGAGDARPGNSPDEDTVVTRRVLIADDNHDSADSLAMLLRMEGHDVRVAHDDPQALAAVASFKPEVALLDIGMPGLNGYEVAQKIREADVEATVKTRRARALRSPFHKTR